MIFWWQGKGYQTALIWLASLCLFGLVQMIGKGVIPDQPWYWSLGYIFAAVWNWHYGSKLNAKRRSHIALPELRNRLFYKAIHRFMSVPMETFSIFFLIVAMLLPLWK